MGLDSSEVGVVSDCVVERQSPSPSATLCSTDEGKEAPTTTMTHFPSTSSTASASSQTSSQSERSESGCSRLSDDDSEDSDERLNLRVPSPGFARHPSRSLTPQPQRRSWQAVMREKSRVRRSESADFESYSASPPVIMRAPRRGPRPASTRGLSLSEDPTSPPVEQERPRSEYGLFLAGLTLNEQPSVSAPVSPCLSPRSGPSPFYACPDSPEPLLTGSRRASPIIFPVSMSPASPRRTESPSRRTRVSTMPAAIASITSPTSTSTKPFSFKKLRRSIS